MVLLLRFVDGGARCTRLEKKLNRCTSALGDQGYSDAGAADAQRRLLFLFTPPPVVVVVLVVLTVTHWVDRDNMVFRVARSFARAGGAGCGDQEPLRGGRGAGAVPRFGRRRGRDVTSRTVDARKHGERGRAGGRAGGNREGETREAGGPCHSFFYG